MCFPPYRLILIPILSWSPDGAHITVSNANNKGYIPIAAVITRNAWNSEISLVGHENTVEVAVSQALSLHAYFALISAFKAYNPRIFLRNATAPPVTSNICTMVALGADDGSISVWKTTSARPLIVAREVFGGHIMDLSWYVSVHKLKYSY
jgi:protein HIRA/HIR1